MLLQYLTNLRIPKKLAKELGGALPKEFDFHFRALDFLMMYSTKEKSRYFMDNILKEKDWLKEFEEIASLLSQGLKPEKKHRSLIIFLAQRALAYGLKN